MQISVSVMGLLKVVSALILLFAVATLLKGLAQYVGSDGWATALSPMDSGAELSVPTWFSAALLGMCGLVAWLIAGATRRSTTDGRMWLLLSVVLTAMSLDEVAGLHERTIQPLRAALDTSGLLHFAWVIPGAIAAAAFAVAMFPFWRRQPRRTRLGMLVAGCLFVGGAVGLEMVSGLFMTRFGPGPATAITSLFEEFLEMAGSTVLLGVLLTHLRCVTPSLRLELRP